MQEVLLIRHGETEWSVSGQHTGRTDIPLTDRGMRQGELLRAALERRQFALVLTSPLARATETCRLAGLSEAAKVRGELSEWDYGAYEGRRTVDIRKERPGWFLWDDGVPEGETAEEVGRRVDRVLPEIRAAGGDVAVCAHGHLLRVLAARWLGLEAREGRLFALETATISTLGWERETAVIKHWNVGGHLEALKAATG